MTHATASTFLFCAHKEEATLERKRKEESISLSLYQKEREGRITWLIFEIECEIFGTHSWEDLVYGRWWAEYAQGYSLHVRGFGLVID